MPERRAQCKVGIEKYPDAGIILNFDDGAEFSKSYGLIKDGFRAPTKNDILQPYISDHDFSVDFGYKLYVFDICYQEIFTASQPIRVQFKNDGVVFNVIYGYVLVLATKSVKASSDGQRQFDLI